MLYIDNGVYLGIGQHLYTYNHTGTRSRWNLEEVLEKHNCKYRILHEQKTRNGGQITYEIYSTGTQMYRDY